MKLDKQELVRLLRTEGDNDTADKVESSLPDEIDTDEHGDQLEGVGLDRTQLMTSWPPAASGARSHPDLSARGAPSPVDGEVEVARTTSSSTSAAARRRACAPAARARQQAVGVGQSGAPVEDELHGVRSGTIAQTKPAAGSR